MSREIDPHYITPEDVEYLKQRDLLVKEFDLQGYGDPLSEDYPYLVDKRGRWINGEPDFDEDDDDDTEASSPASESEEESDEDEDEEPQDDYDSWKKAELNDEIAKRGLEFTGSTNAERAALLREDDAKSE